MIGTFPVEKLFATVVFPTGFDYNRDNGALHPQCSHPPLLEGGI
jgi:hypothetical protein